MAGEKDFQLLHKEVELVKFYRQNPVIAADDILNVDLAVPQQAVLVDMWFRNYIIFCAGRGSGKCITGDTLIPTSKGFVDILSLGNIDIPLSELKLKIQGADGIDETKYWYYDGFQHTHKITTNRGYSIEGTSEHKLIVLSSVGKLEWKKLADIQAGDYLALNRENKVWSDTDACSENQALVLGLLIGDGCFRGNDSYLGFTNSDRETIDLYSSLLWDEFNYKPAVKWIDKDNCWLVTAYGYDLWCRLENLGIRNGDYSGDKDVPSAVLKSGSKVICAFLRGLFETDGGCESDSSVSYTTKSKKLAQQVHILLLSLGVVSSLRKKWMLYKGEERLYWTINFSSESVNVFQEKIGFITSRKKLTLASIVNKKRNPNLDVVPNQKDCFFNMWDKTRGVVPYTERDRLKRYKYGYENPSYISILREIKKYPFDDEYKQHLVFLYEKHYFFDVVETKESGFAEVFDFVVPQTHSFVGNGFINHNTFIDAVFSCLWALLWPGQRVGLLAPSFRQAKLIFAEVDRIWHTAPLLQESTKDRPVNGADRCHLSFKQSGTSLPSVIEAIPLGDGGKIRGARYHAIIADEYAQIPADIFNAVIRPMGATSASPMEKVRKLEKIKALVRAGKAKREDFEEESTNKIIMSSSAFYQFNHMYKTLKTYEELVREGDPKYAVHTVSYKDMPEAFLDEDNIQNARRTMPGLQFRMEYEAIWEADSAGVFKASLLEMCKNISDHSVQTKSSPGKQYVLGIDPARSRDGFALFIMEVAVPSKVVAAWEFYQEPYPQMAELVIKICDDFNVIAVHMDAGAAGGGLAFKDMLQEEKRFQNRRLLDVDDDTTEGLNGKRILHMFHPSPTTNAEAVYAVLSLMEQKRVAFPRPPRPEDSSVGFEDFEVREGIFATIEEAINQLTLIVVTETKAGVAHFDVPEGGGHGAQKKDLYSSFILAAKKIYDLQLDIGSQLPMAEIGIVEEIRPIEILGRSLLSTSLEVLNFPVTSWAQRKTFKPSGT